METRLEPGVPTIILIGRDLTKGHISSANMLKSHVQRNLPNTDQITLQGWWQAFCGTALVRLHAWRSVCMESLPNAVLVASSALGE